jgi:DNA-binding IclR family transcriptional regulator
VSLSRASFVERDVASGRYTLGGMARTVGYAAIRGMNVVRMATARLPKVRTALNQTTVLAIWSYHGPVVVSVEDVRRPVTVTSRVGDILPILTSASGRVFGAWLPPELTDELIRREIAEGVMQPQEGPVRDLAAAHALLAKTRTMGVARIEGTPSPVISALAAPIFDYAGALVATLAVLGPTETFDSDVDGGLAAGLKAAASEISQELGFKSAAPAPGRK